MNAFAGIRAATPIALAVALAATAPAFPDAFPSRPIPSHREFRTGRHWRYRRAPRWQQALERAWTIGRGREPSRRPAAPLVRAM